MRFSKSRPINRNGEFVAASLESIVVAAGRSAEIGDDFKVTIVDSWGARAYPIASFMWFVVLKHIAAGTKRNAVAGFLRWMLGPGQRQAAALGYLLLRRTSSARKRTPSRGFTDWRPHPGDRRRRRRCPRWRIEGAVV